MFRQSSGPCKKFVKKLHQWRIVIILFIYFFYVSVLFKGEKMLCTCLLDNDETRHKFLITMNTGHLKVCKKLVWKFFQIVWQKAE